MERRVWIEADPCTHRAIRIFKNRKAASKFSVEHPAMVLDLLERSHAVGEIRRQVFERDGWMCVHCGAFVIWEAGHRNSGELDERQARGETIKQDDGTFKSGEISVANSQTLCHNCHTAGPDAKHDRSPSFSVSVKPGAAVNDSGWYFPIESHIT